MLAANAMCMPGANCTAAACCRDMCTALPNAAPCDDGNPQTTQDQCQAGMQLSALAVRYAKLTTNK
jgi:hypothetical protein